MKADAWYINVASIILFHIEDAEGQNQKKKTNSSRLNWMFPYTDFHSYADTTVFSFPFP